MRRIAVLFFLLSVVATPSHALNIWDKIRYKEVRLTGTSNSRVLVDRATNEVAYVKVFKKWEAPDAYQRKSLQRSYDLMIAK